MRYRHNYIIIFKILIFIPICFNLNSQEIDFRGGNKMNISYEKFWKKAYQKKYENTHHYVKRLSDLIEKRMLLDYPSKKPEPFEWCDEKNAIFHGHGLCSQHAIIFNNICRKQHIESFIISIKIHVLNFVIIDNDTIICDPTFNVVCDKKKMFIRHLKKN